MSSQTREKFWVIHRRFTTPVNCSSIEANGVEGISNSVFIEEETPNCKIQRKSNNEIFDFSLLFSRNAFCHTMLVWLEHRKKERKETLQTRELVNKTFSTSMLLCHSTWFLRENKSICKIFKITNSENSRKKTFQSWRLSIAMSSQCSYENSANIFQDKTLEEFY